MTTSIRHEQLTADVCVVGGGLAGVCAAVTAARAGAAVVLLQDRPVLGGNASSEVRLWALGATAHMKNNNRWARESGVIGEITAENLYRNQYGNPIYFDAVLLDAVLAEPTLTLRLNTAVDAVEMAAADRVGSVSGFNAQTSTRTQVAAAQWIDASGDGILAFLAGAEFRVGAESREEFGEDLAPSPDYGRLLGQTIFFTAKRHDRPVPFVKPAFAYSRQEVLARSPKVGRHFSPGSQGVGLYWVEYGGRLDPIHDTEAIKFELWRFLYGLWDHLKNSGEFTDTECLTLEWMGTIPGKRESRRFAGDAWLTQADILGQRPQDDAIGYGGWSIDLHHSDGIYARGLSTCEQWYAEGIYPVPYRCLYAKHHRNLFLAGRIISASHVAFGSTRVMATCAYLAQAAGMAAALVARDRLAARDLAAGAGLRSLQNALHRTGQHIPGHPWREPGNPIHQARLQPSSTLVLERLPDDGPRHRLDFDFAQMLPLGPGRIPAVTFTVDAAQATTVTVQFRTSRTPAMHSPQVVLASAEVDLAAGTDQALTLAFPVELPEAAYGFYTILRHPAVHVHTTSRLLTGILSVEHRQDQTAAGKARPAVEPGESADEVWFELWYPQRRPTPWRPAWLPNAAIAVSPPLAAFDPASITNGWLRPTSAVNAWVADPADPDPSLALVWPEPQTIREVEVWFDGDYDHPAETVTWGHSEPVVPFQVVSASLHDESGRELGRIADHHQARVRFQLSEPILTSRLELRHLRTADGRTPPAIFAVWIW